MVLIASSMLFVACGDKTKEAANTTKSSTAEAVDQATKATKEAASKAADAAAEATKAAKEKAAKLAEEAKAAAEKAAADAKVKAEEVAKAAKEKAADVAKAAKEKAAAAAEAVKEKVTGATASAAGAALYGKCAGCHGKDGKTKALGKSAVIAGQETAALVESMQGYKAGTRNVSGMGTLMKGQVGSMGDSDIEAVAAYISALK